MQKKFWADKMMKIIICDDSLQEIETLAELCRRFAETNALDLETKALSDSRLLSVETLPDVLLDN